MKKTAFVVALALAAILVSAASPAFALPQEKAKSVDMNKIYAEIAGDYDFDAQGQLMTITFFVREGKLFGAPQGEQEEELLPVKGDNPLKFEVTVASNGQFYELEFGRDEKGQIDKCAIKTQGMELVGKKKIKTD